MVQGLAERERIRDAFGTYLDDEVAEYILSDGFDEEGIELDVSILFTDVHDFTSFAAGAEAKEVVGRAERSSRSSSRSSPPRRPRRQVRGRRPAGRLRRARAVPRPRDPRHPRRDRDLPPGQRARRRPATCASASGSTPGASSPVPIGGAGRLNFSVIGDAVNVAARVEAMTREIDGDVLLTRRDGRRGRVRRWRVESMGEHRLRGVGGPVELFAPTRRHAAHRPGARADPGQRRAPAPRDQPQALAAATESAARCPRRPRPASRPPSTAAASSRARCARGASITSSRSPAATSSRSTTAARRRASRSSTSATSRPPSGPPRATRRRPGGRASRR